MDYIAGSFYDGFVLYAKALEETLAEGGAQNDGINITMRTQNRRFWGEKTLVKCIGVIHQRTSQHSSKRLSVAVSCAFDTLTEFKSLSTDINARDFMQNET